MDRFPAIPSTEGCTLCPRACNVVRSDSERGVCGVGSQLRVARAALHEWEEPCISVGAGSGAVFFSGCPLHCVYCQNAAISDGRAGRDITVERLVQIFFELRDAGACNINLVTPTQYALPIAQAVARTKEAGFTLPIVWNTSGYETESTLRMLDGLVDVYLDDMKYASTAAAARYSHAPDYPETARRALRCMVEQVGRPVFEGSVLVRGVVMRHLLLPGLLEQSKQLIARVWNEFGTDILYSFMNQYTPQTPVDGMPELDERVSDAEYEQLLDCADGLGMTEYYWQLGGAAQESFIPAFDLTGVQAPAAAAEPSR